MKFPSKPLFLLALFFSVGLGVYFSSQVNTSKLTTRSSASGGNCSGDGESDFQGCVNGGNLTNGCNWICNTAPAGIKLVSPSCCEELARTGDPTVCCFDARRRCTPEQCSSIPDGVSQERCAQLWVLGYCTPPVQPSATPRPTARVTPSKTPTPTPTKKPEATKTPTQPAQPTNAPQNTAYPTQSPNPTSSFEPTSTPRPTTTTINNNDAFFWGNNNEIEVNNRPDTSNYIFPALSLPEIRLPQINIAGPVATTVETVDRQLPRSLDFIEYVFRLAQSGDQNLEAFINETLSGLLRK